MHRREVLKLWGLVLLGGSRSPFGFGGVKGPSRSRQKRTLVVGAGLAGLAAARELRGHGHEVIVLEARDRIGGRIWTSNQWLDLPLDLGATWIHGVRGNPMTELADGLEARRFATSYQSAVTYNSSGSLLTDAEEARLEDVRKRVFRVLRKAQSADTDTSVRQAVASLAPQLGDSPEAKRLIEFVLNGEFEQEYSGGAHDLSAHWYDSSKEFGGDDAFFARGFRIITDFLARDIRIELSQVVEAIDWRQDEVKVITRTGEFAADHVVVTLPLGVLQHGAVRFSPELPEGKRSAIGKLGMGVLNKCYLRFPHAFWPHDVDWLEHVSARPGEWAQWVSFQRASPIPVLLGFNAADYGREIEAWSDQQIVASAMVTLRTLFGAGIPEPIDYQITRWASDPFARGSYSFNALGSTPEMRDALATPLNGRLFFAGEAANKEYFGTTHGAYLSGLRAAGDVLSA